MTTGIDDGPILHQDSVPVGKNDNERSVSRAKVDAAVKAVPTVIDSIEANHPGVQQTGDGSYFTRDDYNRLCAVDNPGNR
jgi:methionyl-tRNA formyltransferase